MAAIPVSEHVQRPAGATGGSGDQPRLTGGGGGRGMELSPNGEEQRAPQRGVWEIFEQRPCMRVSGLQDIKCRKTLCVQGRRGLEQQMHDDAGTHLSGKNEVLHLLSSENCMPPPRVSLWGCGCVRVRLKPHVEVLLHP